MHLTGMTILLQVFNIKESVKFYRDLLGFFVIKTSGGDDYYWAYLKNDNLSIMLNTSFTGDNRPHTRDTHTVRLHNDIILYFYSDDVQKIYEFLTAKNWPVAQPIKTPYGKLEVYTNDPDGYEICFQQSV